MALPTSPFTISATTTGDYVFTRAEAPQPGVALYYAPAGVTNLAGRTVLTVRHSTSQSGLVSTNLQVKIPIENESTGAYDKWIQGDFKLTRSDVAVLTKVEDMVEIIEEILEVSGVRAALASASY